MFSIQQSSIPALYVAAFMTQFPVAVSELELPSAIRELLQREFVGGDGVPILSPGDIGPTIRKVFRSTGFKPSGRSKPASEYLRKSIGELPEINVPVDVLNAVSLHSGLPISVIDLEIVRPPFSIAVVPEGASYVFNQSGQEMDIGKLVCLSDVEGPCANPVKDSQRTKLHDQSKQTLSILWGAAELANYIDDVCKWYQQLLEECSGETTPISIEVDEG